MFPDPSVAINALFVQVVTLPIGKLFERTMPKRTLTIHGYSLSLNSGPFNIKEHTLISVMANIVVNGAPFAEVSAAQTYFFNSPWPLARQFILGIAIQLIGFSFAGLVREFLVWPASMIWPGVLVRSALLNTMHNSYGKKDTKHISRGRFLFFACLFSFIWYWLPGFLWTGLSMFNWVCWIVPDNVVVNTLFGYQTGLGMGFLTFDWAMISYVGSPLVIPVSVSSRHVLRSSCSPVATVVGSSELVRVVRVLDLVHRTDLLGYVSLVGMWDILSF